MEDAARYMKLAETEAHLSGSDQEAWLHRLEAEHEGYVRALGAELEGSDPQVALRTALGLTPFWYLHGHFATGLRWLQQILAASDDIPDRLLSKGLWAQGLFTYLTGEARQAVTIAEESLRLAQSARETSTAARALGLLGRITTFSQSPGSAVALLDESVFLARESRDDWFLVDALAWCGQARRFARRPDAAESFEACLTLGRETQDLRAFSEGLTGLGWMASSRGDLDGAQTMLDDALRASTALGNSHGRALVLSILADVAAKRDDLKAAEDLNLECLSLARGLGTPFPAVRALTGLGLAAWKEGHPQEARSLLRAAVPIARQSDLKSPLVRALLSLAAMEATFGDTRASSAAAHEASVIATHTDSEHGIAGALFSLAMSAELEGDEARAGRLHHRALDLWAPIGDNAAVAHCLEALARLSAPCRPERAARLVGAARSIRSRELGDAARNVTCAFSPDEGMMIERLGAEAFEEARGQGARLSLEEALAYAVRGTGPRSVRRRAKGWDSLTPTEQAVARLAMDGLSNSEIASRLLMSRRTVRAHLTQVYQRLGIRCRRELDIAGSSSVE